MYIRIIFFSPNMSLSNWISFDVNTTVETTTQEIKDVNDISGNITNGGDIYGDNQTNKK